MNKEQIHQARHYLSDQASTRYQANQAEIRRIKELIAQNRSGTTDLLDITQDQNRKRLRIARVESSLDPMERVNGVPNFQDIAIIKKITQLSESVCRIITESPYGGTAYGTGFLVAPNLLLTNNHVLPDASAAFSSLAQFRYEISPAGVRMDPVNFKLRPDLFFMTSNYIKSDQDPTSGLDFTLVGIEELSSQGSSISEFGFAQLDARVGKVLEGESCVIIQHPKGDYKKIVLKDIRMISLADNFLIYESDTHQGSSGSLVAGLGTGEIIALHHSAVPRKDDQGNWLRKDGSVASNTDPDSAIDWIGNEGVRISRIIKMIQSIDLPASMTPTKLKFLQCIKGVVDTSTLTLSNTSEINQPTNPRTNGIMNNSESNTPSEERIGYFEIQLVSNPTLERDWEENIDSLVPGFIRLEQLFESHTDRNDPKLYYLTCKTTENPWISAEQLERLPHVDYCAPDLPLPTDGMRSAETGSDWNERTATESALRSRGYARHNESDFISKWRYAKWIKDKVDHNDKDPNPKYQSIRSWNWEAVNMIDDLTKLPKWNQIKDSLNDLSLVQLDTGYSTLSKVDGGFDFQRDYDFVEYDGNARDELKQYFMKHPYHGTRTASLIIGGQLKDQSNNQDGNRGLLTLTGHDHLVNPVIKVIPYRVANSVILVGRSRHVLSAVEHAVNNSADVMFMCMGSIPTPGLDMAARVAYENGIIWVCAAGNEVEFVVAPASFPGTIAVAATNPNDQPWEGSSYGEMVDVAAPGERVYVPFINKHQEEIMVYGDGTSYATPHVASAAMLWKAQHAQQISKLYKKPWQIVEAFRYCLSNSSRKSTIHGKWKKGTYGDGILDVQALLKYKLPDPSKVELRHAYLNQDRPVLSKSYTTQAFHALWQGLVRIVNPWEPKPYEGYNELTEGGKEALEVLRRAVQIDQQSALEGSSLPGEKMAIDVFRQFAEQYRRNVPAENDTAN